MLIQIRATIFEKKIAEFPNEFELRFKLLSYSKQGQKQNLLCTLFLNALGLFLHNWCRTCYCLALLRPGARCCSCWPGPSRRATAPVAKDPWEAQAASFEFQGLRVITVFKIDWKINKMICKLVIKQGLESGWVMAQVKSLLRLKA